MLDHAALSEAEAIRAQADQLLAQRAQLARQATELRAFQAECEGRLATHALPVTTPYEQRISRAYRDAMAAASDAERRRHLDALEWLLDQQRLARELEAARLDVAHAPERERIAAQVRTLDAMHASLGREIERVNLELASLAKRLVATTRPADGASPHEARLHAVIACACASVPCRCTA